MRGTGTRVALLSAAAAVLLMLPAAGAQAADAITVTTGGPKQVPLLTKLTISGTVTNPAPGETVQLTVTASGRDVLSQKLAPGADGGFSAPLTVDACCDYVVKATAGDKSATADFVAEVPKKLRKGPLTALYNQSLQKLGFHTGTKGARVTEGTRLATKAFRKTNGMPRSERYSPEVFRLLLQDKGAFEVQHPDAGKHVEVDLSKQVMALIEGDTATQTFHISSGTNGTRTVRGKFRFYRKDPGYNEKRMYFSAYFIRGYATHGFSPVPNEPASHGCVRNPIPFSRFIYNWVEIGMPIYVYN